MRSSIAEKMDRLNKSHTYILEAGIRCQSLNSELTASDIGAGLAKCLKSCGGEKLQE